MRPDRRMNSLTPFWLRECFYGNFMSPATTYLCPHVSVHYFCPILSKFGFPLTDFHRSPQYKILQKSMQLEPH